MPVNFITKIQEGNGEAVAGQQQVCSSYAENLINLLNTPMPNLQEGAEKTKANNKKIATDEPRKKFHYLQSRSWF